jgi:hypothetical protein
MSRMSAICLYLGFGLLPFWSSIVYVYLGSEGYGRPQEYWAVAPWVIIIAAPYSAITLAMAGIISLTYKAADGSPHRSRYAFACFVFFLAIVLVGMEYVWSTNPPKRMSADQATRAAERFVENDSEIAKLVTGAVRADSRGHESIERAYRFVLDVSAAADGEAKFKAIVETSWFFGQESFRLRCLIPARDYAKANPGDDPCRGGEAP